MSNNQIFYAIDLIFLWEKQIRLRFFRFLSLFFFQPHSVSLPAAWGLNKRNSDFSAERKCVEQEKIHFK